MKAVIRNTLLAAVMAASSSLAHAVSLPQSQWDALDAWDNNASARNVCALHAEAYKDYAYLYLDRTWRPSEFREAGDYLRSLGTRYGTRAAMVVNASQVSEPRLSVPMQHQMINQLHGMVVADCLEHNAYR